MNITNITPYAVPLMCVAVTVSASLAAADNPIRPHALGDLTHVEASIKTVRGVISSSWKRAEDSFVLEIEIPVNSTSKVSVPTLGLKELAITEGSQAVWKYDSYIDGVAEIADGRRDADWVTFDVGSGSYRFELRR